MLPWPPKNFVRTSMPLVPGRIIIRGLRCRGQQGPTPADQQQFLVELDALQAEVDALKRLQAETAAELDALLPSILDKAFKGEL